MPDLDTPERIDAFIDAFYEHVLDDPLLAPVFLDVAAIDVPEHLAVIKGYWRKMLLGHDSYRRNMMARHEAVHGRCGLEARHFERWLALYRAILAARFQGPYARRADTLAVTIAGNMQRWLHSRKGTDRARRRVRGVEP
ncbi:group III truncated hemoglobin [Aquisalimonas lutea]|uniref:group III truncated hemoglobin n=1 Tax=Aquisalimonas lutea TaxID=1327750 RepID=UPI0025B5BE77|nr:group III truncated hemoglobin [Aquisalimonas lutea]MDN3517144.1 group III truncated hemoglobin [Aquisalimonas lutea]